MARLPRLSLSGCVHYVTQRGNNGQPVFADGADRERMLELLGEQARLCEVDLHAYALVENQIQLLLTPQADEGLSRMMQAVGRSYVRYFNDRHGRTGTLWEGRYRATILQPERYLLAAMVYIDLSPVRSQAVMHVKDYPWTSHGHYVGSRVDRWLTPHALYWGLGNTPFAREAAYDQAVQSGGEPAQNRVLEEGSLRGWPLGDEAFVNALQDRTARRVSKRQAGRPMKTRQGT